MLVYCFIAKCQIDINTYNNYFFTLWDLLKIQFLFKGDKIYFHPTVLCCFIEIITQTISCKQNKCNEFIQNTRSSDVL